MLCHKPFKMLSQQHDIWGPSTFGSTPSVSFKMIALIGSANLPKWPTFTAWHISFWPHRLQPAAAKISSDLVPITGKVASRCLAQALWMAPIHYRPMVAHPAPNAPSLDVGPLETRGWTFQERALAKRFVSFGKHELLWSCSCLWDCECDWTHVRRGNYNDDLEVMLKNRVLLFPRINQLSEEDLYHEWRIAIVSPYSNRSLTFSKDRLVALSAITKAFHKRLDDKFLAGLWRKQLHRDLGWYRSEQLSDGFKINGYIAPSWSWTSLDPGVGIVWNMPIKGLRLSSTCHIIEADCTPASEINPFGSVSAGHITLEGLFVSATAKLREDGHAYLLEEWPSSVFHADMFIGISEVKSDDSLIETATRQASMNREAKTETADFPVWCLVLYKFKSGQTNNADILVLGRSVSQPGKFERVGFMSLD